MDTKSSWTEDGRYIKDGRFTSDKRSHRVPGCVLHDTPLVSLFDALRDFRREAENLVAAEAEFDAGRKTPKAFERAQFHYEKARAKMLAAERAVRCSNS